MRWRFVDRVDAFKPWDNIEGRKGISLEEYSLLERFGRSGVVPQSLIIECCVQFACWLVTLSSDYCQACILAGIREFEYESEARMGDNLRIAIIFMNKMDRIVYASCEVHSDNRLIVRGTITLELIDLDGLQDPESMKILWRELYGQA